MIHRRRSGTSVPRQNRAQRRAARGAFAAAFIALAVLPAHPAGAQDSSGGGGTSPDIDPLLASMNPDAAATQKLQAALGESFAGTWRDPESGSRQVALSKIDDESSSRVKQVLQDEVFDLVAVSHSKAELEDLRTSVFRTLSEAGERTYLYGVNVPENRVDVAVSEKSPALAQLRELARSTEALSVETAEIGPSYDVTDRGGVRQWTKVSSSWYLSCTTGFALDHPTHGRVMSTAGHCSSTTSGEQIYNSTADNCSSVCTTGSSVGNVIFRRDPDVLIYSRSAAIPYVWNGGGYPVVKGGEDAQWLEQDVCFRGATSVNQKCAGVSSTDYAMSYVDDYGKTWSYTAFCLGGGNARPGDSGSAAYKYRNSSEINAKGIITSYVSYTSGQVNACGSTISNVLDSTGTSLVKG